jgi:eukaryotic-like serine/threonine-protein kinase
MRPGTPPSIGRVPGHGKRCIAAAVALAALAGPAAASAAPPTVVSIYSPFSAAGALAPGLRAVPQDGGSCATGSFVVVNPFAFRCSVGDRILDPCYLDGAASTAQAPVVDCVAAPWAASVVRLHLGAPPGTGPGAAPDAPPWALQLASGRRCVRATGATTVVRGRRLSYVCDRRRVLFGRPDASAPVWRIRQARDAGGAATRVVTIAAAWR